MYCSYFKTTHELGLDPCKRGWFISSILTCKFIHISFVRKDPDILVQYVILHFVSLVDKITDLWSNALYIFLNYLFFSL